MLKKRWYDQEPTTSMAVSLLQNASIEAQLQTTDYILTFLKDENILEESRIQATLNTTSLLPFLRQDPLQQSTWRLLEIMKALPKELQLEVALNMIQFIYTLDSGVASENETVLEA